MRSISSANSARVKPTGSAERNRAGAKISSPLAETNGYVSDHDLIRRVQLRHVDLLSQNDNTEFGLSGQPADSEGTRSLEPRAAAAPHGPASKAAVAHHDARTLAADEDRRWTEIVANRAKIMAKLRGRDRCSDSSSSGGRGRRHESGERRDERTVVVQSCGLTSRDRDTEGVLR